MTGTDGVSADVPGGGASDELTAPTPAARRHTLLRLGALVPAMPVTLGLLTLVWLLSAVLGALPSGPPWPVRVTLGVSPSQLAEGRLWTLVSSGAVGASWVRLSIGSVVWLLAGAALERRVGHSRMLLLAVLTQVVGAALACVAALAVEAAAPGTTWAAVVRTQISTTPVTWIVGTLVAGAAVLDTLWRRRIRAVLLTVAIAMVLFTGQMPDLLVLGGVLAGFVAAPLVLRLRHRAVSWSGATLRESRTLVALVVAAGVLGPVLVSFNANAAGPLWPLSQLFLDADISPADAAAVCAQDRGSADCRVSLQDVRLGGLGSALMTLVPAATLVLAAVALRRGLRFAHRAVLAVVALLVLGSIVLAVLGVTPVALLDVDDETLGHAARDSVLWIVSPLVAFSVLAAFLVVTAPLFSVRLPRGTVRRAGVTVVGIVGAGLAVYVVAGGLVGDGFDVRPSVARLAADYPQRLLPPLYLAAFDPELLAVSQPARLLQSWIGVLVAVPCLAAVWWTLRSAPEGRDEESTHRLRELLRTPGGSTLSWMTTWAGNHYWFSGDAAVAYRVRAGVAVTTGDPVCAPGRRGEVTAEFAEHCVRQGWTPCLYSVSEEVRAAMADRGWGGVQVAQETVVDLAGLEFRGKKFQDVRTALNRAGKEGVEALWGSWHDLTVSQSEQIVAISEEWVADKGMPEMGFTLGGVDELRDPEVRILLAVDAEGHVQGVTSWMPVYRNGRLVGRTLDFMRRRAGGFRPVMEFLIASAALSAKEEGLEFLSLSGAPLAQGVSGDPAGADLGALDTVLERLGRSLEPVYGFRSLLSFKAKFQPEYRPLYLCYPDAGSLLAIGVAVGRAYLPDVELGQGARLVRRLVRRAPVGRARD